MSTLTEEAFRAQFPQASESTIRRCLETGVIADIPTVGAIEGRDLSAIGDSRRDCTIPKKRIRQSAKPLLNKLETEWRDYLRGQYPDAKIYEQAFRFRLANGLHYTPDLALWVEGRLTCWECKGPHSFRGGFENLKSAANRYQEIDWRLCWKVDGEWCTQEVLP